MKTILSTLLLIGILVALALPTFAQDPAPADGPALPDNGLSTLPSGSDTGTAPAAEAPYSFANIMGAIVLVIVAARAIVKLTPTPADDTALEKFVTFMKHVGLHISCVLLLGVLCLGAVGCAPLNPGANPIIVRTEQGSQSAKATFELILNTDNANRSWWRTNAAPFHEFAESLRVPVPCQYQGGTTNLPKWAAILWSVDRVKLDYKAGLVTSNALLTAESTITGALNEANNWLGFTATNQPPR